jgi:hypothetical protein
VSAALGRGTTLERGSLREDGSGSQLATELDEERFQRQGRAEIELLEGAPRLADELAGPFCARQALGRAVLLEELASWYRDLVVVAVGAERAVVHADRLAVLAEDGTSGRLAAAERACELVRETWRAFEEFNLSPPLALEALFVKLRRELGTAPVLV